MKPLMHFTDFALALSGRLLLKNINLCIEPGKIIALTGENGAGKSSMLKGILGLLDSNIFRESGKIVFQNQDLLKLPSQKMQRIRGREISLVTQNPTLAWTPLKKIETQLLESVLCHQKLPKEEILLRISSLFYAVGLSPVDRYLKAYPFELSGGENQKLMIVMALLNRPKLVLLDEPLSALDADGQKKILALFRVLKSTERTAFLWVTHNTTLAHATADQVYRLEKGCLKQGGATKTSLPKIAAGEKAEISKYPPFLEARNLSISFQRRHNFVMQKSCLVLKDIHLKLFQGESIGIFGANGAGKTTLALALMQHYPAKGQVLYKGVPVDPNNKKNLMQFRRDVRYLFQQPERAMNPMHRVRDLFAEALLSVGLVYQDQMGLEALQQVGLGPEFKDRFPRELSGGEAQRVALAVLAITKPKIYILDEPTAGLDEKQLSETVALLQKFQMADVATLVVISHDRAVLKALCPNIYVLKEGCLYPA